MRLIKLLINHIYDFYSILHNKLIQNKNHREKLIYELEIFLSNTFWENTIYEIIYFVEDDFISESVYTCKMFLNMLEGNLMCLKYPELCKDDFNASTIDYLNRFLTSFIKFENHLLKTGYIKK